MSERCRHERKSAWSKIPAPFSLFGHAGFPEWGSNGLPLLGRCDGEADPVREAEIRGQLQQASLRFERLRHPAKVYLGGHEPTVSWSKSWIGLYCTLRRFNRLFVTRAQEIRSA